MLSQFEFRPDYNKSDHDIASEFYLPCMRNSIAYDRSPVILEVQYLLLRGLRSSSS